MCSDITLSFMRNHMYFTQKKEVGVSKLIMNIVNKQFSIMVTSRTPGLVPAIIECFRLSILSLVSLFVKKWEIHKNSLHVKHNDVK